MKVVAFQRDTSHVVARWLSQSHRLRAKVFQLRLHWDVAVFESKEIDAFDQLDAHYLVALDANDEVVGMVRFLSTSGPTMLSEVFPYLLTSSGPPPPGLVEASRFCVDTERFKGRDAAHQVTQSLFAGMIEWALRQNIPALAAVVDLKMERLLRRAGWPLLRSSPPHPMGKVIGVAGFLSVREETFEKIRPKGYLFETWPINGTTLCFSKCLSRMVRGASAPVKECGD